MRIETYLRAVNGQPSRLATRVILNDGTVLRFLGRVDKQEAVRQAMAYLSRATKRDLWKARIAGH